MSHDDDNVGVDELAALAKQIDLPAPDEQRVEMMRSSLLRAAAEDRREPRARWPFVAGGFTAGALAAAAAAMVVLHVGHAEVPTVASHDGSTMEQRAQIEASSAADFERTVTHGAKGNEEVVRLHAGRISLAVAELPSGDRVRVAANNGEIEGSGLYEVAVVDDAIREVKVKEGSARVRLVGSQEIFLATGQVWRAPVITADLKPADRVAVVDSSAPAAQPRVDGPHLIRTPDDISTVGATPTPTNVSTGSTRTPGAAPTAANVSTRTPSGSTRTPADVSTRPAGVSTRVPSSDRVADAPTRTPGVSTRVPSSSDRVADAPTPLTTAPAVPALQTMTSETPDAPPQAIAQIAKAEKKPVTVLEQHFAAGWALLRANKPAEAARELAAAADAGGDDPLAGDARYFEAVAQTKAGRKTEAEHTLIEFMDRSPHAVRVGVPP